MSDDHAKCHLQYKKDLGSSTKSPLLYMVSRNDGQYFGIDEYGVAIIQ